MACSPQLHSFAHAPCMLCSTQDGRISLTYVISDRQASLHGLMLSLLVNYKVRQSGLAGAGMTLLKAELCGRQVTKPLQPA